MHWTASTLCEVCIHSWSQNAGNSILEAHILKLFAGEYATGSLWGLAPSALVGAGSVLTRILPWGVPGPPLLRNRGPVRTLGGQSYKKHAVRRT